MPETIIEKIDPNVKYNKADNDDIVSIIVKSFDKWDEARQPQIKLIKQSQELIDVNEVVDNVEDKDSYQNEKDKVRFRKIKLKDSTAKRILNTSVAHTYSSTYKALSNIIAVDIETEFDEETRTTFSALQKESLLNLIKKSKAKKEFRKGIENWYLKGEKITYVNWKQSYVNVRRKATVDFMGMQIPLNKWEYQKILKYDGASIKNIEPEDLVFDVARVDDFENTLKIHPAYKTYQEIINNENYKEFLTSEQLTELKDAIKSDSNSNKNDDFRIKDGMIEVLEAEGDFNLERGNGKDEFYPNMKICIIAGKFVGYFAYNPNVQCSYIYCPYEVDPETKRGIPLLAGLISNSLATTETLNKINTAIGLSINKCYLGKEEAFVEGVDVKENGIIPVRLDVLNGDNLNNVLKELDFATGLNSGISFLEYLKGEAEEQTQRFKLSSGDAPKQARTLGENKMIMQGQNVLFSYENEKLLEQDIIPMFEKLGELQANMQDKDENIRYKNGQGEEQAGVMDSEVRQSNFTYSIIDAQVSTDKKMNNMEYIEQLLTKIAPYASETGQGIININELMNIIGSAYEQEDFGKLLMPQPMMGGMNGMQPEQGGIPPNAQAGANAGMEGGQAPLL